MVEESEVKNIKFYKWATFIIWTVRETKQILWSLLVRCFVYLKVAVIVIQNSGEHVNKHLYNRLCQGFQRHLAGKLAGLTLF